MSNIFKNRAHKQILTAQPAQTKHKRLSLFWVNFEHGGAGDVIAYNSMSILKTEAAQTKILLHNEAQTNGLFRVLEYVGGLSDLRMTYKYYFNI